MAPYVNALDWLTHKSQVIKFDCLLPTGIIVPLEFDRDFTLSEIKDLLWKEAQKHPLFGSLGDKNQYVFQCVTRTANKMELLDEGKNLDDYGPFGKFLKVIKKSEDKTEIIENAHITYLIGKGVHEFNAMNQPEVSNFRRKMRESCEKIASKRDAKSWQERVQYLYPTEISDQNDFPLHIVAKLPKDRRLQIKIILNIDEKEFQACYMLHVECSTEPRQLIELVLAKASCTESADKFVLKVAGREEYLLSKDEALRQYMFIRKNLTCDAPLTVVLKRREDVLALGPPDLPPRPEHIGRPSPIKPRPPSKHRKSSPGLCLWDIDDTFRFKIDDVSNFVFKQFCKFQLRCRIYHGPDQMCDVMNSGEYSPQEGLITFNETLECKDLEMKNIPRMARLCFMFSMVIDRRHKGKVAGVKKKRTHGQDIVPLGWVNIPVFDYKANLRNGKCTLYMWDITEDNILSSEDLLNPIGTVESNPLVKSSMCLTLTFNNYHSHGSGHVYFPLFDRVLEVAAQHTNFHTPKQEIDIDDMKTHFSSIMLGESQNVHAKHFEVLEGILSQDALTPMEEQDKDRVWKLRYECLDRYPGALPKLLASVNWGDHVDVAQMQALLQCWKPLKPVEALELLDFAYADNYVRQFATSCLKEFRDPDLQMYLLQLVQVLKYESYLDCELVTFLLDRALNNQHIGHNFFWLLRSEVGINQSVAVRFGLILEAYCRGTVNHMKCLVQQVDAMDMLHRTVTAVKNYQGKDKPIDHAKNFLVVKNLEAFKSIQSPLDPGLKISNLVKDELRVMDSKMKPIWLEFANTDTNVGEHIKLMYKKGDDMRQDMLTLQILKVIDKMWKEQGLDLRLTPYGCLATGDKEGLIEIVTDAETISTIQKKHCGIGLAAFNRQSLYKWLLNHNENNESMEKAMDEFMHSCAGYSVATYVLGVGDRHGDNIMLKKNGQLCHIDYGHIMGHFKKALGGYINREPAPFQLTPDFVYLLQRGPASKPDCRKQHFNRFKDLCLEAYMLLREQRKVIITLFLMMVNVGMPELQSVSVISQHLNKTLVPGKTEKEARDHFQARIKDALGNAFKLQIHGHIHNLAH